MAVTLLSRARLAFDELRTALCDIASSSSGNSISIDQPTPGRCRVDVMFFEIPGQPRLRVSRGPKPTLLPDLEDLPPVAIVKRQFDAIDVGNDSVGWIESGVNEGAFSTRQIESLVRELA